MWHETGHRAEVTCILRSPQKDIFAVGYADGSIRLWSASTSSVLATFNGHKKAVTALAFDETGTRLASGSQDTDLILWDVVGEAGLYRYATFSASTVLETHISFQLARPPRPNHRDTLRSPGRGFRAVNIYRGQPRLSPHRFQGHILEALGPLHAALHPDGGRASLRSVDNGPQS